ncbi:hypothetical protein RYA05_01985 [Pseudomonas syringae pv. actinidiae]|nr:hypothetical protein [Pseudomonas syringae pv. actinidiae]
MIRINGKLHYEPEKGDFGYMELIKELCRAGRDRELIKGKSRDELLAEYIEIYGDGPVPVPPGIMATARDTSGRII